MHQLTVLQSYEAGLFDKPPKFTKADRKHFFILDPLIDLELKKIRGDINTVGLLLQYGYFKACGKFYTGTKYPTADIAYVARQLKIDRNPGFAEHYSSSTRRNHKTLILMLCGYSRFSENKALLRELTVDLVAKQLAPRKILFSLVDLLRDKKIEVPHYDTFLKMISEEFNRYEKNNLEKITPLLESIHVQALMQLIEKNDEANQRPLLVRLKSISQSIKPAQIKRSLHGFLIIKKLRDEVAPLIEGLDLSPEATRYYARWIIKAKVSQVIGMTDTTKRCLYLLAFVAHQYKMWQDTLLDILQKCVQQQLNKLDQEVNRIIADRLTEKNALTGAVLQGYQQQAVSIKAVRQVLYSEQFDSQQKVFELQKIVPQQETEDDQQQQQNANKLAQELEEDKKQKNFYDVLEKLSRKLQNRVADIVRYITFTVNDNQQALKVAIEHYQKKTVTKNSPQDFLSDTEKRVIFEDPSFTVSLYKSILFIQVAKSIKSGEISLTQSYRYMPMEAYLIKKSIWEKDRARILEKTNLAQFADIDTLLTQLAILNRERFYAVNECFVNGENPYLKLKKEGGFSIHTPALDKPDYDSFADLVGRDRFVPILQMMAEGNAMTQFTHCLSHHKTKGAHKPPSNEVFFAGIFGLGSNIGLHKLASTALGISYSQLSHSVNWYFSLENLHAVNSTLVDFMNKLWLPNQFKKEKHLLHTSSDAQKRCVSAESLNANFSYKYFGHGSGSNIYTFLDERGILFYTNAFSSAERDAAYVIDGLMHNENFQSDMHSTDTHGFTETIFAISHLIGIAFAPRLKNATSQALVSFAKIKSDLAKKSGVILPQKLVNQTVIKANWDTILRFVATIKLREQQASVIIKRLNSYDEKHPLQVAMKEFGRVIKTAFLLEYFDDVELRQKIEKQLNKGELANKFSSAVSFANNQEILQVEREEQEIAIVCKVIIQNIIILWNYVELTKMIIRADEARRVEILANILNGSILAWGHANLLGTYDFRNLMSKNDDDISFTEVLEYKKAA